MIIPDSKQKRFAFSIYLTGLILLVASLPLSKFVMSVSQFMIVGGWLLDGDFKNKFRKFYSSKLALVLISLYVMHLVGLIYTTDFKYAFHDLRIKLPLLILPFLLLTSPRLQKKHFQYLLFALIGGVFISSMISFMIYAGVIVRPVNNIRDLSIFISHIRLALLCCLSVFTIIYLVSVKNTGINIHLKITLSLIAVWLIYFLFLIESLTGIVILMAGAMLLPVWLLYDYGNTFTRIITLIICISIPLSVYLYVKSVNESFRERNQADSQNLPVKTPSGNDYVHASEHNEMENGYRVWNYVSEKELEQQWNLRSKYLYYGKDDRNQDLRYTLIRFLTSKGSHKDSTGVWNLSDAEIKSIERGIANVDYQQMSSIRSRVHQVLWEFYNRSGGGDPSGHSVAQRFEYWKAAIGIICEHPLTGVGTGDVKIAFNEQYNKTDSPLSEKWRLKSHNQYLSFGVAFGITGMIWFAVVLIYPLILGIRKRDFLYTSFTLIIIISMFTEDTLETQAGATFYALFGSLLLFVNPQNEYSGVNLEGHWPIHN